MPIMIFENRNVGTMELTIEPSGKFCEIPHLARAGVRYSLNAGAEDPCHTSISEGHVLFWCEADDLEIEVVLPSQFDKLSWSICVGHGWCGGIVDGRLTTVDDLLPESGIVTAQQFAELAIRADGWPKSEPFQDDHVQLLKSKFEEHMGASSVDVSVLRPNLKNPFE